MTYIELNKLFEDTFRNIQIDSNLSRFIEPNIKIPNSPSPTGTVKLIILGQDPTVKSKESRKSIKAVLNLDKKGSLTRYLSEISLELGLDLKKNVYATNLLKNFFIEPPTTIKDINIFNAFIPYWLPVLKKELEEFPNVPIISLGEPLLQSIIKQGVSKRVREYWGYQNSNSTGDMSKFKVLNANENILNRLVIPFPHQPSINKEFYWNTKKEYLKFIKTNFYNS